MSYLSVVNTIKAVAEAVNPDGLFVHCRTWDAALEFSEAEPQIFLYPMTAVVDMSNHYYESYTVRMGFYFQDVPDSTNETRQAIINNADILCRNFLATLYPLEGTFTEGIRCEPSYRQMAGTYTGYILFFTFSTTTDICSITVDDIVIPVGTILPQPIYFYTIVGQSTYTAADVPRLAEAIGHYMVSVTMNNSILNPDMRSWDDTTFTLSDDIIVEGGEYIVITYEI